MNLFSRNLSLIFKTFLYQIVMSIFGLMMYGATSRIRILLIVGSICVIAFFIYIMFSQMYQQGSKNCEYDIAHQTSSPLFVGFVFALIAFLPTIIASTVSIFMPPFAPDGNVLSEAGYIFYLINKTFLQGMYTSLHNAIVPTVAHTDALNAQPMLHLISAIPGIIVCGVAYLVGYLRFRSEKKKAD